MANLLRGNNLFPEPTFLIYGALMLFSQAFISLSTPITISYDGYLYLASAQSMFSPDMAENFHWAREPLYPLFLRVALDLGGIEFVKIMQSVFISCGLLFLVKALLPFLKSTTGKWFLYILVATCSLALHGYANSILQQSLFIFIVGMATFVFGVIVRHKRRPSRMGAQLKIALAIFLVIVISAATSITLSASIIFSLAAISALSRVGYKTYALFLGVSISSFLLIFLSWNAIKQDNITDVFGKYSANTFSFASQQHFSSNDFLTSAFEAIQAELAILNVGKESYAGNPAETVAAENRIFGLTTYAPHEICGKMFGQPEVVTIKLRALESQSCGSSNIVSFVNTVSPYLALLFPFFGFSYILGSAFLLGARKRVTLLFITPLIATLPYALLGLGISRYGSFVLPFGAAALALCIDSFVSEKSRRLTAKESVLKSSRVSPAPAEL